MSVRTTPTGTHAFVVVANRLPVERVDDTWRASPGGLVRALVGVLRNRDGVWVGWTGAAGDAVDDETGDATEAFRHDDIDLWPVALSAAETTGYYDSVANGALWPLYHDAIRPSSYDPESFEIFRAVNRRFAECAATAAGEGATVWIHDYHLQLVPAMLRELRPDLRIGFFLHIPFPPQELFMRMPWREEILEGLLGADLVGFQRRVAAENFESLARRLVGADSDTEGLLTRNGRLVRVGAFPISIDVDEVQGIAATEATTRWAADIRARLGNPETILLGVDRLDYTKGIEERLVAFRTLLQSRVSSAEPVDRPPLVLVQVAVPSRETVDDYRQQRERVEQLIGAINGDFATLGHPAVHYLHQGLPYDELIALYRAADVMVVTPLRDGMNLVAKEFTAARTDGFGVLVLSEFAGAADELCDAVIVNPHDPAALVAALETAITMSAEEEQERMAGLRKAVASNDARHWADSFLRRLG